MGLVNKRIRKPFLVTGVVVFMLAVTWLVFPVSRQVVIANRIELTFPNFVIHRRGQGMDTLVGTIKAVNGEFELNYDVGFLAGNGARYEINGPFQWKKQEIINGHIMDYSLTSGGMLIVTIPEANMANVYASGVDQAQIDLILKAMRAFQIRE